MGGVLLTLLTLLLFEFLFLFDNPPTPQLLRHLHLHSLSVKGLLFAGSRRWTEPFYINREGKALRNVFKTYTVLTVSALQMKYKYDCTFITESHFILSVL